MFFSSFPVALSQPLFPTPFSAATPPPRHLGLSLSRSVAIPNLPILIYIRAIAYRLRSIRHAVRRIATLPGLERPSSPNTFPVLPCPGRLDTSCSMARDARSIRASHEIPTSLEGGRRGINPRDRRMADGRWTDTPRLLLPSLARPSLLLPAWTLNEITNGPSIHSS